jgi:hypothetical protein
MKEDQSPINRCGNFEGRAKKSGPLKFFDRLLLFCLTSLEELPNTSQHMGLELFLAPPGCPSQVVVLERMNQDFRLV